MAQPDLSRFALGRLAQHGPLLIANGRVHIGTSLPRWREVASLGSIEDLDAMASSPDTPSRQRDWHADIGSELTDMLPEAVRPYADNVLTFVIQAERYRTGKPFQTVCPIVRPGAGGPGLHQALGAVPVVLICRGIVFVPRMPLPGPHVNLPTGEGQFLPFFQPGGAITLDEAWARYEVGGGACGVPHSASKEFQQEVEAALEAIRNSCRSGRAKIDMQVIYDCDETSLAVLSRPPLPPLFTISSDPWVVEDADGALYRMDGFTVGVLPHLDGQDNLLVAPPAIVHPQGFEHWRHPGGALHFCTHQQDWPVANVLQVDNAVTLLLSGKHLVRAGLYGPAGTPPVLTRFVHRRITREEADNLGLPVYPFERGQPGQGIGRVRMAGRRPGVSRLL